MRISSLFRLGLMTAFIGLAFCPGALACVCVPPAENLTMYDLVKQSVERTDIVFLGIPKVLHGDGETEGTEDLVIFDASKIFKGEEVKQISVHSGVGTTHMSSCGFSFEVGRTYLVFASRYKDLLFVAACSFTGPIEKSDVALRFLRKEPPHPEDLLTPVQIQRNEKIRILGVVRRRDSVALHDPKVYIWDASDPSYEKEAWFTRPRKDGSFESYFLSPGRYRVTAVDSSYGPTRWVGCYALDADGSMPAEIDVMAGRDYHSVDIVLREQKVYSIQGVVRSEDKSPLPLEHVEIRATMVPNEMFPFLDFIQPQADGRFYIPRVPVGNVRLKTYVGQYMEPNWETSVIDMQVSGDVENIAIVMKRKAGPASSSPDEEDLTSDERNNRHKGML